MAKDRCISSDILMNDNFMSLPNSAKVLYVYFNQETDNLGFVDNLSSIMAMTKSKQKDLDLLIEREYIVQIKDWLYLETHFRLNNKNLRPERGKRSRFAKHLEGFEVDDNGIYRIADKMTENCRQIVGKMSEKCPKNSEQSKVKENKVKENKINQSKLDLSHISTSDELKQFFRGEL